MSVIKMVDVDLQGKRVLIREDLNVPVAGGTVTSDARIRAALPTIRAALDAGAAIMLMSHLGRPTEGAPDVQFSLQPVADSLAKLLGRDVPLVSDWIDGVEVATDPSGNTPIGMNKVSFNAGGNTLPFFGKTKCLAVWKETLTDTELAELTTI